MMVACARSVFDVLLCTAVTVKVQLLAHACAHLLRLVAMKDEDYCAQLLAG